MHIPVASLRSEKANEDVSFLCLDRNVLDVGLIGDALIVSTDNIHQSGSTTEIDSSDVSDPGIEAQYLMLTIFQAFTPRLQAFQAIGEEVGGGAVLKPYTEVNNALAELNQLQYAVPGGLIGVGTTVSEALFTASPTMSCKLKYART